MEIKVKNDATITINDDMSIVIDMDDGFLFLRLTSREGEELFQRLWETIRSTTTKAQWGGKDLKDE